MGVHGPAPKPSSERIRRNVEQRTEVPATPPTEAPPLRGRWPKAVREWYRVWATSPQANQFLPTDWQRLAMLAPQVQRYFETFSLDILKEIRQQETLLGATMMDRLRLRMDVEKSADKPRVAPRHRLVVVDEAATG